MPFGLIGAPFTFQREMNKIIFSFIGESVNILVDDALINSKSIECNETYNQCQEHMILLLWLN